jgi:hypothetical protein
MTEDESDQSDPAPKSTPRRMRRLIRALVRVAGWFLLALGTTWATLAVCFADLSARTPRVIPGIVVAIASFTLLIWLRPRRRGVAGFLLLFAVIFIWWAAIRPSNARDWDPSCARTPTATISGDTLVVRDVRCFNYASESQFDARYEDRTYDLSRLATVDYILCYFGPRTVAHAMMSFGFDDGRYLLVSIEARRERGEVYSPTQGLFKQYELIYVFADERDAIRLRTNFRDEDVYLYRTTITPPAARRLLLSYVDRANRLAARPEFYHARSSNCMTNLADHLDGGTPGEFAWSVLFNGYSDRYGYELDLLDRNVPFDELRRRSRINEVARAADGAGDFSTRIRAGLRAPDASRRQSTTRASDGKGRGA